jgi:hypothetical protein
MRTRTNNRRNPSFELAITAIRRTIPAHTQTLRVRVEVQQVVSITCGYTLGQGVLGLGVQGSVVVVRVALDEVAHAQAVGVELALVVRASRLSCGASDRCWRAGDCEGLGHDSLRSCTATGAATS